MGLASLTRLESVAAPSEFFWELARLGIRLSSSCRWPVSKSHSWNFNSTNSWNCCFCSLQTHIRRKGFNKSGKSFRGCWEISPPSAPLPATGSPVCLRQTVQKPIDQIHIDLWETFSIKLLPGFQCTAKVFILLKSFHMTTLITFFGILPKWRESSIEW